VSDFRNSYEDAQRAFAYDELGLGGTYGLAFDTLRTLLPDREIGKRALDFSCGTGRSGRFLIGLASLLSGGGRMVNVVSTPEIYTHEWVTFTTRDFPGNRTAQPGDLVRIVTTEYSDARPVDDVLWPDEWYKAVYEEAGLEEVVVERPLASGDEGVSWKSETLVPPWAIYVLKRKG